MGIIVSFLTLFIIAALILLVTRKDKARGVLVKVFSVLMIAGAVAVIVLHAVSKEDLFPFSMHMLDYAMTGLEVVMAVVIIVIGIKNRSLLLSVLALVQTAGLAFFEITIGKGIKTEFSIGLDRLSMIVIMMVALAGALIAVYALRYMKRYHENDPELRDRRNMFFAAMFLAFGGMTGMAVSNNILWMYFFWEVMIVSIYFMTGYRRTETSSKGAVKLLTVNMFAGLLFVAGIVILGRVFATVELDKMILIGSVYEDIMAIPAIFIALGGVVMSAQIPFSGWLARAAEKNAPAVAVTSCVTGVTSGVFVLIKMAPLLGMNNFAGISVMVTGGISFTAAAFIAIGQNDAWKLSSYSTVAVMGLITACAGMGTAETLWSAVMLFIFHCFTKLLVIMCIGSAEEQGRSDDAGALFRGRPDLTLGMLTGTGTFFVSMLGLFVFRESTLAVFAGSGNILLMTLICFGSFALILYLVKWMGRFIQMTVENRADLGRTSKALGAMKGLVVLLCILMPVISMFAVTPYMSDVFGGKAGMLNIPEIATAAVMTAFILLITGIFSGKKELKVPAASAYVRGIKAVDSNTILRLFDERKILITGGVCVIIMMIVGAGFMIGTLTSLMGGAV